MERTGSSSLISSLAAYGNDEDMSDEEKEEKEDGFNISDEEEEGHGSRASSRPILEDDNNSEASLPDKEPIVKPAKRKRNTVRTYSFLKILINKLFNTEYGISLYLKRYFLP